MTTRLAAAAVVLWVCGGAPPAASAQKTCDVPEPVRGVRDAGAVSTFMTGYPSDRGGLTVSRVSYLNYQDIGSRPKTIALAAVQPLDVQLSREADGVVRPRRAQFVSSSYFDVLGVTMQAGRGFTPRDDDPAAAPLVAVISDALWVAMFDRNPAAIGQRIHVNGRAVEIVGIAPWGFSGVPEGSGETLWLPGVALPALNEEPGLRADDRASGGYYLFLARLAFDATWPEARAELDAMRAWLLARYPAENEKFTLTAFHDYGPIGCPRSR